MSSVIDDAKFSKETQDVQDIGSYDQSSQHGAKEDVFVDEESHDIHYKTLSWQVKHPQLYIV